MNEISPLLISAGIIVNVILLAGLLLMAVWNIRLQRKDRQTRYQLEADFADLCSVGVRMGQRIDSLESRLKALIDKIGQIEDSDSRTGPYRQALRLADKGAKVDELMTECGVTLGEAELIANLRRLGSGSSQTDAMY